MPFGTGNRTYLAGEPARQHGHMYALCAVYGAYKQLPYEYAPHPEPIAFLAVATRLACAVHIDGLVNQHVDIAVYKEHPGW